MTQDVMWQAVAKKNAGISGECGLPLHLTASGFALFLGRHMGRLQG
jgi:hypothetical protein